MCPSPMKPTRARAGGEDSGSVVMRGIVSNQKATAPAALGSRCRLANSPAGHLPDGLSHTLSHGMVGVTATAGSGVVSPGPPIPFEETVVGLREK